MKEDPLFANLKAKHKKILTGKEIPILISYKGELWEGAEEKNGDIIATKLTGRHLFGNERIIHKNQFRVIMTKFAYASLVHDSHSGATENIGGLVGTHGDNNIIITNVFNLMKAFIQQVSHFQTLSSNLYRWAGGGSGGSLASKEVDEATAKIGNVVGFYHTHPTMDPLSPNDRAELKRMAKYPHLKKPGRLHVLCRRSAIHRFFSKYTLLPRAYWDLKEIPVIIKTE